MARNKTNGESVPRDPEEEERQRREQERIDREERQEARRREQQERQRLREIRNAEERQRPEKWSGGERPPTPRPGQIVHITDERKYLRWNEIEERWDNIERHRLCDHWVRKNDPVEMSTHECVDGLTPIAVFQCLNDDCRARYRVARGQIEVFRVNHRNRCPTCGTEYTEDMPREAIAKDYL